ncbi:uncharacterized protein LOC123886613 [Trifolium pratense]|uniref:uncharacterized protein LOC123886613 n=1 Tax=Trifolium pratense TaxID=57577 RepID=UPI001E693989|nr:uncharacterized protein LOC123886613 [Trifolium pratense]
MIPKAPWLLCCNPSLRLIPKFQFFLSKGASKSDIVNLVSKHPMVLSPSLENHIIPTYELFYRFVQSDKDIIAGVVHNPSLLSDHLVSQNITMLINNGVTDSSIARLFRTPSRSLNTNKRLMMKLVEEMKDLGLILQKQPLMGWDVLAFAKGPSTFSISLEKRIIPRASVVQFLLKKGLRKKDASLTYPFKLYDKMFLDRFIMRFKEQSSYLLKLYEEKLTLAHTREGKTDMS